ncbi:hypothetical protein [Sinorhizobium sp. GL28]|uniref:hypothetical protein n=1 Tax=Sinorhizobium sp. GL28 TaxID=1358418 RepID=UPI00071DFA28|nr:hypothetical protein [Sinorhizobium sp. GL28]KSV83639.1 hypothetical protein N184_34610 [Sinorhizobium sp. GL28]
MNSALDHDLRSANTNGTSGYLREFSLGERTSDWVVIYHQRDGEAEGRSVVVTRTRGWNAGQRIVRGRETAGQDPL